jgi:ParB-like chromosome segregation protein Spo0J
VIIDETSTLLAGHGRFEAAKLRGLKKIPAIRLHGLSEAKKRALLLADNKIAENAGWDREGLAIELPELTELLIAESLDISARVALIKSTSYFLPSGQGTSSQCASEISGG